MWDSGNTWFIRFSEGSVNAISKTRSTGIYVRAINPDQVEAMVLLPSYNS